jgi:hypothetical protein
MKKIPCCNLFTVKNYLDSTNKEHFPLKLFFVRFLTNFRPIFPKFFPFFPTSATREKESATLCEFLCSIWRNAELLILVTNKTKIFVLFFEYHCCLTSSKKKLYLGLRNKSKTFNLSNNECRARTWRPWNRTQISTLKSMFISWILTNKHIAEDFKRFSAQPQLSFSPSYSNEIAILNARWRWTLHFPFDWLFPWTTLNKDGTLRHFLCRPCKKFFGRIGIRIKK